jgi:Fe-S-cluster containining protein
VPLSTLCLACGRCCDGTLFSHVALAPGEAAALARAGVPLATRGEGAAPVLPQRCGALEGRCCQAYAERPAGCRRYRCQLHVALGEGEVSLPEALEAVAEVDAAVDALARLLPPEDGGRSAVQRVREALGRGETPAPEVHTAWERAEALLDRHLRGRTHRRA